MTNHFLSFPTRRSSDLIERRNRFPELLIEFPSRLASKQRGPKRQSHFRRFVLGRDAGQSPKFSLSIKICRRFLQKKQDRKSTRLNSSHTVNSYAVFCLK